MVAVLFISIALFFIIGMPIAFAMGVGTLFAVIYAGDILLVMIPQRVFTALDSWLIMAVPLFMLAGKLMLKGGMSKRTVDFATELFGFIKGGLAIISVAASMVFAGVSGSSTADTAAIGSIMLPAMKERGYNMKFATALQAAAGSIGPVIPPSILMIIIGYTTDTSIAQLFLGGIIPGVLIGVGLMVVSYLHALKGGKAYLPTVEKFSLKRVYKTGRSALPGLGLPFIIIFGIVGGVFTATEAAVVAVVYGFLVGIFVYREIKVKDIPNILIESAEISCIVMFVVTTAFFFARLLILKRIPLMLIEFMQDYISSQVSFLIFVNVVFLLVGMFIDTFSAVIVFMPLLFPIAQSYGIDPVHFGVMATVNLAIGYITPPFGATLFVSCSLTGKSIRGVTPYIIPIALSMLVVLIIITYFPATFMWIPNMIRR